MSRKQITVYEGSLTYALADSINRLVAENDTLKAERAALVAKLDAIRKYAEDRAFHARGHLNTVNSGRIAGDLFAILDSDSADHLNTVKAEAWDEGYVAAQEDHDCNGRSATPRNPYRTEQGEQADR